MVRTFVKRISVVFAALLFSASITTVAETPDSTVAEISAHDVVREVTRKMEQVLVDHKNGVYKDNAAFEVAVGEILDPVVSYRFITRNVMGKNVYKEATESQREAFTAAFKDVLMSTYAKAMVNFGELTIEVIPPVGSVKNKRRINVSQKVKTAKGDYRISYVMGKGRSKRWQLINVVLARANLGLVFAGQFKAALAEHNNDLDAVTRNWGKSDGDAPAEAEKAAPLEQP
jgi:phospholipid transport system substrate-binding protein